jgi:serine/threonine protein kinase
VADPSPDPDPAAPPAKAALDGLPATVGRYRVVRLLGEGAMGRVLLARDPVLDRDVALKHLRLDLKIPYDVRQGLLRRLQHEARAVARVAHPNLVVLHDMGEDPQVGLYLVMEFIVGPTLKQRLADGRMPAAEAAKLAGELGAALTTAHEAGILHRDVKPENIMLPRTGGKIADFGIARIPDSTLTHQGGLMGTPAYSAPETLQAGKFSPASDQFSLAASLYEVLAGRRAFPGNSAFEVASTIASKPAPPFAVAAGLPPAVDEVLGRAMSMRPEDRFPSCEAFGAALSQSLSLPAAALVPASPEPGPVEAPAATFTPEPATRSIPAAVALPRQRRLGQVVMGGLVVVGTAALLVRAVLLSVENDLPGSLPTATAPRSARVRPPVVPAPPPVVVPRPVRTHVDPGPRPDPTAAGLSAPVDAGAAAPVPLPAGP